ncbi:unnamed protein product [Angiostrongylus costaricensis]|uniref:Reelin domain-containing protein n=1 Tax=Angiostrongylus costaricensis TaxID=334426 RepID=A0A0R3PMP2_ANGCS|nr:unnamed protein product [Angiostrongylus costaricensis]
MGYMYLALPLLLLLSQRISSRSDQLGYIKSGTMPLQATYGRNTRGYGLILFSRKSDSGAAWKYTEHIGYIFTTDTEVESFPIFTVHCYDDRFNTTEFVSQYGLKDPVAGSFFRAQFEPK